MKRLIALFLTLKKTASHHKRPSPPGTRARDTNDQSAMLLIRIRARTILFAGDVETVPGRRMGRIRPIAA
ncbi:MAG: hypothetical protein ACI4MG_08345 [Aristaeellaceae bacterium]